MPVDLQNAAVSFFNLFVGEGWQLTLGLMFMLIVIFLPGGIMEGAQKIWGLFRRKKPMDKTVLSTKPSAAE